MAAQNNSRNFVFVSVQFSFFDTDSLIPKDKYNFQISYTLLLKNKQKIASATFSVKDHCDKVQATVLARGTHN